MAEEFHYWKEGDDEYLINVPIVYVPSFLPQKDNLVAMKRIAKGMKLRESREYKLQSKHKETYIHNMMRIKAAIIAYLSQHVDPRALI